MGKKTSELNNTRAPTPPTVGEQPTEVALEHVVKVTVTAGAITGEVSIITAQVMPEAVAMSCTSW